MDYSSLLSAILLLLVTGPLMGGAMPTGSGEIPEALDEDNMIDQKGNEEPKAVDSLGNPLELSWVHFPPELDDEEGSAFGEHTDEEKVEPTDAAANANDDVPRDNSANADDDVPQDKSANADVPQDNFANADDDVPQDNSANADDDVPQDNSANADDDVPQDNSSNADDDVPQDNSGFHPSLLPNLFKNMFSKNPFSRIDDVIEKFERDMNEILRKALSEASRFNGTTTNSTRVVDDEKGNLFKVDTVIKKGDNNQTLIVETIESMPPPTTNRTKRSNWFAESYQ